VRYSDLKSTVVEVAMNPTAYAQSMKQADEVKIGFEFEVCVPQYRIADAPELVKTATAETVQDIITYNDMLISGGIDEYISPTVFDKLFKFKAPSKYSNMTEVLDDRRKQALPQILKLFHEIPENKRVEAIKEAKDIMARSNRRNFWKSFGSKELYFAYLFGYQIYLHSGRSKTLERIGLNISNLADIRWSELLNAAFESDNPSNEQNVQDNLTTYFTFDPDTVYNTLNLAEYKADEDDYDDDNDYGYDYLGAVKVLKPALEKTMNSEVTVFSSYHQKTKNMTSWYIEPDGSLNTVEYDDGAAEIVGPPQPAAKALETLANFYSMAKKLHLYTNDSTGLHINISIPQNIDILKLAVFSGDQYVLQQFNRLDNDYAASVIRDLKTGIKPRVLNDKGLTKLKIKSIEDLANSLTNRHTASITNNGKYISFRQVGGNYLNEYDQVLNVVGRFVRAIIIASDPNAYRKEYLAELGKLIMPTSDNSIDLQIEQLRKEGLKVTVGYIYISSFSIGRSRAMKWETLIKNIFFDPQEYSNIVTLLSLDKNSEEAKLKLSFTRSDISAAKQRQLQAADIKNFAKFVVPTDQIPKSMSYLFDRVHTQIIGSEGQWKRFTLTNTVLPPTDPIVQKLILSLRKQKLGK
jgi:hypothetical protein